MEQFTAVAQCPSCGDLGVHWLSEPRRRPNPQTETPQQHAIRLMQESFNYLSLASGGNPGEPYEPDTATVARICRNCKHRWAQQ